jgi:hypothetical protein
MSTSLLFSNSHDKIIVCVYIPPRRVQGHGKVWCSRLLGRFCSHVQDVYSEIVVEGSVLPSTVSNLSQLTGTQAHRNRFLVSREEHDSSDTVVSMVLGQRFASFDRKTY